jgi:replicative DNA helicase
MPIETMFDLDAEEAVLGSLLIDGEAMATIADWLKPEHFGRDKNRWIYQAMLALYKRGEDVNLITVDHELAQSGKMSQWDAFQYNEYLVWRTPTCVYLESYARIVARLGYQRELLAKGKVDLPIEMPKPKIKNKTIFRRE